MKRVASCGTIFEISARSTPYSREFAPAESREEQRLLHDELVRLVHLPVEARVGDHLR
tara:strand:- start:165 stop:338 length:174 start_codon:yes stop_codon:yes gene_type:complete